MSTSEHVARIEGDDLARLRSWLDNPNGALVLNCRISFESVEGGSIQVRTNSYAPYTDSGVIKNRRHF